jgi:hypothetical protein
MIREVCCVHDRVGMDGYDEVILPFAVDTDTIIVVAPFIWSEFYHTV